MWRLIVIVRLIASQQLDELREILPVRIHQGPIGTIGQVGRGMALGHWDFVVIRAEVRY